ncbi:MAG: putative DNA modification/repair radical SAM protein [Spirochaetes bacterium GWD1_61_31]|nr:MAG: putative DNA modification/repair radical SAM protein [Spirochaetes bacterium GWB1_60_80]OHD40016.1 MAG: putative DNA modification/repair radical SAM protein [Spirochaetes bacterium GWD1_61_31]
MLLSMIDHKLTILANAAKYDASCSTSGSGRQNQPGGIGNAAVSGICHSWSADGRCVALLKVLLSNACAYDCAYCVNRRSNDIARSAFEPEELVRLIMDFYRRNYIEGALLSSGVCGGPDATMERLIHVARSLRQRERFNGYLHIKVIPGASDELILEAARWADRASVNIELPSAASLRLVAPDKLPADIFRPMRSLARAGGFEPRRLVLPSTSLPPTRQLSASTLPPAATSPERQTAAAQSASQLATLPAAARPATAPPAANWPGMDRAATLELREAPVPSLNPASVRAARQNRQRNPQAALLPAGQTTQMVIGASPESDYAILNLAENLYLAYDVRRVYYSAYMPVGDDTRVQAPLLPPAWSQPNGPAAKRLPEPAASPASDSTATLMPSATADPPTVMADQSGAAIDTATNLLREHRLYQADWLFRFYGFNAAEILSPEEPFLDRQLDPKAAWALRNLQYFPVDINKADYHQLLRVPGIGPIGAKRIIQARRQIGLKPDKLRGLGIQLKRAQYFITCSGQSVYHHDLLDRERSLRAVLTLDGDSALPGLIGSGLISSGLAGTGQTEFAWT